MRQLRNRWRGNSECRLMCLRALMIGLSCVVATAAWADSVFTPGGSSGSSTSTNAATLQTSPPAPQNGSTAVSGDSITGGNATVTGNVQAGGVVGGGQFHGGSASPGPLGARLGARNVAPTAG